MKPERKRPSAKHRLARLLKWLVPLAVIGGLIALAVKPKPITVDVGEVRRGSMRLTVDDDGEARVRDRYLISAPLAGRLLRIALDPGDAVKKGDVLATIDPGAPELLDPRARAQAEAAVRAAEAGVASARTQVAAREVEAGQLEKAFVRNQVLHDKGNIADADFEKAESAFLAAKHALEAAAATVEIKRFEMEQAQAALLRYEGGADEGKSEDGSLALRSPIDGRVLRVHEESSHRVEPGAALLEVGDPGELEMRIDVLSQDAVRIKPGQEVIVEHWGGESPLKGRVRHVEPSAFTEVSALGVDEQRVNVIADFETRPSEGETLADGYRIEARIVVWEGADVLMVPVGALFRDGADWAVYRIEDGKAWLTRLTLGRNNGEVAEVPAGLGVGDRVILHPGDRIADDTLIAPRP